MSPEISAAMQLVAAAVNEQNRLARELAAANERVTQLQEDLQSERTLRWEVERKRDDYEREARAYKQRASENYDTGAKWRRRVDELHAILRENGVAGPWSEGERG